MVLSKTSWMVFGLGALGLVGCGGAGWDQNAGASESAADSIADESSALAAASSKGFLSLGDSIAFGFNPFVAPIPVTNYIGYPEYIASKGNTVTNASCPGETSSSFFSATEPDNSCRGFKAQFALHADYETTQLAYVLSLPNKKDFKYITLNIGANDLFLLQTGCAGDLACIQAGLRVVVETYARNLRTSYNQMETAGYKAKFIGLTTYAINYNDPLAVGALTAMNDALRDFVDEIKGKVADGFGVFQTKSAPFGGDACAAGLLIRKPDNTCDVHPSQEGREYLGDEILDQAK